jgi:hypothetical protein
MAAVPQDARMSATDSNQNSMNFTAVKEATSTGHRVTTMDDGVAGGTPAVLAPIPCMVV